MEVKMLEDRSRINSSWRQTAISIKRTTLIFQDDRSVWLLEYGVLVNISHARKFVVVALAAHIGCSISVLQYDMRNTLTLILPSLYIAGEHVILFEETKETIKHHRLFRIDLFSNEGGGGARSNFSSTFFLFEPRNTPKFL